MNNIYYEILDFDPILMYVEIQKWALKYSQNKKKVISDQIETFNRWMHIGHRYLDWLWHNDIESVSAHFSVYTFCY